MSVVDGFLLPGGLLGMGDAGRDLLEKPLKLQGVGGRLPTISR